MATRRGPSGRPTRCPRRRCHRSARACWGGGGLRVGIEGGQCGACLLQLVGRGHPGSRGAAHGECRSEGQLIEQVRRLAGERLETGEHRRAGPRCTDSEAQGGEASQSEQGKGVGGPCSPGHDRHRARRQQAAHDQGGALAGAELENSLVEGIIHADRTDSSQQGSQAGAGLRLRDDGPRTGTDRRHHAPPPATAAARAWRSPTTRSASPSQPISRRRLTRTVAVPAARPARTSCR